MSTNRYCIECQEDTYLAQTSSANLGFGSGVDWGTFECFFRLESKPDYSCLFKTYCTQSWETRLDIEITPTQVTLSWYEDDDTAHLNQFYSVSVPLSTWYHLVFKYDSGTDTFDCHFGTPGSTYNSGYTQICSIAGSGTSTGFLALFDNPAKQQVGIGARNNGDQVCDARICDYRMWSDERSDTELGPESGGGYNDRMCPESNPGGGLYYWKLNDAEGYQTDHWGTVDLIPEYGGSGASGSYEYDDSPFPAPSATVPPLAHSYRQRRAG